MNMQGTKRIIALLLVAALLSGFAVPASASANGTVTFTQVGNDAVSAGLPRQAVQEPENVPAYADTDMVRVSVILEQAPTLHVGFSTVEIAGNEAAMAYRTQLQQEQKAVTARIEQKLGRELDVVWNLTLAANIISANVAYGDLDRIAQVKGVEKVILETRYQPMEAVTSAENHPNMMVSADMTGANRVWESGYTGGGMRIAVIDTGLDTDHQSFSEGALTYALMENAELAGLSYEEYLAQADLLDAAEVAEKLSQLNVAKRDAELTAADLYLNAKAPFAYNYIDLDLDVTHDNDTASEHGSHVAGIAAANRYIRSENGYASAAELVATQGAAPDAQIITMKVFGKLGGAYDSDYMAAIEDAIILGCDVVNLSLGTSNAGFVTSEDYQELMDYLAETDTVVTIAAGNEGYWAVNAAGAAPNLYIEDVNFSTTGAPGSYANAFTVGSVDNDGAVGPSMQVGERSFGYSDGDGYWNEPMATLDTTGEGTEYEYVFLDSIGLDSDYSGIDVTGKIVFVSRGETNFADKANAAFAKGAIATVICNNVTEGIQMDLSGYYEEAPCVIISMANGQAVKAASTAATTASGVTYYTGKLTVHSKVSANVEHSDYYNVSSFSSWGVPGDLSLKPEILAPGGSIYSVNGAVSETDQYEMMSGTSMATPHVAGVSALVQQAIDDRGLSQDGMTDRALTQSLLMSTAQPLKDGEGRYYPVIQQGAGLVDVLAATSADSYVTVEGQFDGKVKAELGDDPERTGVYSFTFTLHNLKDRDQVFALSADLFTQDAFTYYANLEAAEAGDTSTLANYLDTATAALGFTAAWETDGELVDSTAQVADCDFDGDGDVDEADGQALLDYVTGIRASVSSMDHADLSGDGDVDTYDVHVFLAKCSGGAVRVGAGESVDVTVTLTLEDTAKEYLDTYYTNGAYIQAYVFADGVADEEGVDGTCHSIPMLAFYGNWSDSSMYEIGTAQTHTTGEELRDPYTGSETVNSLTIEYAWDPGYIYYLGGNPVVPDGSYMPERNAINNKNGDKLNGVVFNPIRNVAASKVTVTNTTTGEVLREIDTGTHYAAYYGVVFFMEMWLEGYYKHKFDWVPRTMNEGETFEVSVTSAPEYYVDDSGNVDWDALGEGSTLTFPVTIDNTAPVIDEISVGLVGNTLTVEATDNRYVAGVALYDGAGKQVITYTGAKADAVPGESYSYELDLSDANGTKFLIQVVDYAYNITTYELRMELGTPPEVPPMIAFDREYDLYWTAFDVDAWYRDLSIHAESDIVFNAATIDSHHVFACSDQGELYVMPEEDLTDMIRIRDLGLVLDDMAYNADDGMIYAVADNVLYSVDKNVGTLTEVGVIGLDTNTLACDASGVFYCNEYGTSKVYSFTLETMAEPVFMMECVNDENVTFATMGAQAMEYDPNTRSIVWTSFYYKEASWGGTWDYSYLFEIHPNTNTYTLHNDLSHQLTALVIPERDDGSDWTAPTDDVLSLELSCETMELLKGNTGRITATVLPWNVSDRTVTWTSSDPAVATVDQYGLVTAVDPGTAVITAVSNLDPAFTDSVTVTVEALAITMEGALHNANGDPVLFTWDLTEDETWDPGLELDTNVTAATHDGSGTMHVSSGDGRTVKSIDMTTGTSTTLGTWDSAISDLAYSRLFSTAEQERVHMIAGSLWIPAKDPADPADDECWDLWDYMYEQSGAFEFVAIAAGDIVEYTEEDGSVHEAEELYLMDNQGHICKLYAYADGDFYNAGLEYYPSNLRERGYTTNWDDNNMPLCSMVMGQDGKLYFSGFNGTTNVFYQLTFNEELGAYDAVPFAEAGENVWPAMLLDVTSNAPAEEAPAAVSAVKLDRKAVRSEVQTADAIHPSLEAKVDGNVTVEVRYDADVTNGLFTASYDAELLTLVDVQSNARLTSQAASEGSVTFGFAGVDAIGAGETVATLVFTPVSGGTAEVTVTTKELNDEHLALTDTVTVTLPEICPASRFEDVDLDAWYHEALDYVVGRGLMNGMSDTIFAPGAEMNRAQLVVILYRLAGSPAVEEAAPFADVPGGSWFADAVAWAYRSGIANGVSATHFAPGNPVNREQMVTFFARYAAYAGHSVETQGDLSAYTDADSVSPYAVEAMTWAVENGIITGMGNSMLAPAGTSNRAQVATVLMRFCKLFE